MTDMKQWVKIPCVEVAYIATEGMHFDNGAGDATTPGFGVCGLFRYGLPTILNAKDLL